MKGTKTLKEVETGKKISTIKLHEEGTLKSRIMGMGIIQEYVLVRCMS
ncbi:MAG: hypothetical protein LBJ41_00020 [Treponema sp.]|nr:hypothetical protein [Treponema sp.]